MISNLYNSKINVVRTTVTADGVGGYTEDTPTTIHTNLPCRINWSKAREKVMFNKESYLRDAKLYCSVVDIVETDVIVYGGTDYDIVGMSNVDEVGKYMIIDIIKKPV